MSVLTSTPPVPNPKVPVHPYIDIGIQDRLRGAEAPKDKSLDLTQKLVNSYFDCGNVWELDWEQSESKDPRDNRKKKRVVGNAKWDLLVKSAPFTNEKLDVVPIGIDIDDDEHI